MLEFFKQHFEILTLSVAALVLCSGIVAAIVYYLAYAVRSQALGKTIWCGKTGNKVVALTFDDGPSPDTLEILDVLREHNVKATFFLIGERVEQYPEIAKRISDENHEIGNHSYSHPIYLFCTPGKTRQELRRTQEIIEKVAGIRPRLVRPPCGVRSPAYFAAAKELGLQSIQWSVAGFDWKKISAEEIGRNVMETVQSDSIVLLHDGDSAGKSSRRPTTDALRLILRGLKDRGFGVEPLSELCAGVYENAPSLSIINRPIKREKQA